MFQAFLRAAFGKCTAIQTKSERKERCFFCNHSDNDYYLIICFSVEITSASTLFIIASTMKTVMAAFDGKVNKPRD